MSARLPVFIGVGVLLILFPPFIFASRSIIISADKSSLFGDEILTITSSVSGFSEGESIFIKGALFKEGSTNYFGYTKKNDEWVKNGASTGDQRSVAINSWDGVVQVRSDFSDSGFSGEGEYKLKLGYYYQTSSGNNSSVQWSQNSLSIVLNEPDPTPTNTSTPTQTPTCTHTPTPVSSTPTSSTTPTGTGQTTKTPTPDEFMDSSESGELDEASDTSDILGETDEEKIVTENTKSNTKNILISIFSLVGAGSGLMGLGVMFYKILRQKTI